MNLLALVARFLSLVFPMEEINGNKRCPTYLYRWRLARLLGCAFYVHRFVDDDWCLDCHTHPKRFVSFMVWGRYCETVRNPDGTFFDREYAAPWLRSFPAEHAHRTTVREGEECWTIVFVYRAVKPWGFWHGDYWIHWKDYIRGHWSFLADKRAVCKGIES